MSANSDRGSPADVGVLIAAGGRGERAGAGTPKQFRPVGGVPMLLRAVRPFARHPAVHRIVIALPADHVNPAPAWLAEVAGERLVLVPGGATRLDSVRAALAALDPGCRVVLVHDAARPLVSGDEIDAVIAAARSGTGAVPVLPVADTLKRSPDGARVSETVPREGLWRALTPQGFPRAMLEEAFRRATTVPGAAPATDDAALVEAIGEPVVLVPGTPRNFKITTADDFALADVLVTR